jgi:hypothetical protein
LVGTVSSSIAGLGPAFGRLRERSKIAMARYRVDGSLDRSFGNGGIVRTRVASAAYGHDVVVGPDGEIFVVATSSGRESPWGGSGARFTILRYGPTGSRQGLVTSPVGGSSATAWNALLDRSGRLVVGGTAVRTSPRRVQAVVARFRRLVP